MKSKLIITLLVGLTTIGTAFSQNMDPGAKKHFFGSTAFMLMNLVDDKPKYYQINYGYRITPKDVISIEAITWRYQGPLGRQY